MEEYCPLCTCVTEFDLEEAVNNCGTITCKNCGEQILACSICTHRFSGSHCNIDNCFEYKSDKE